MFHGRYNYRFLHECADSLVADAIPGTGDLRSRRNGPRWGADGHRPLPRDEAPRRRQDGRCAGMVAGPHRPGPLLEHPVKRTSPVVLALLAACSPTHIAVECPDGTLCPEG